MRCVLVMVAAGLLAGGGDEDRAFRALRMLKGKLTRDERGAVVQIALTGPAVTDAALPNLAAFKGFKALAGLEQLQSLKLSGSAITDAGLREVAELKHVKTLDLSLTPVTDASL